MLNKDLKILNFNYYKILKRQTKLLLKNSISKIITPIGSFKIFIIKGFATMMTKTVAWKFINESNRFYLSKIKKCAISYEDSVYIITKWKKQYGDPILALNNLIKIDGKFRNLIRTIIANPTFLLHSYEKIKNKINFITKKNSLEKTLNLFNFKWIEKTATELKQGKYIFGLKKKNIIFRWKLKLKQKKGLAIINFMDKIVQKAIEIVLSEIYENLLK